MTTNRKELFEHIAAFLEAHADTPLGSFDESAQLLGELCFNSLDLMNIVNDAEDEFGIVIDDEDMLKIVTVGDVVDLVERKTAE